MFIDCIGFRHSVFIFRFGSGFCGFLLLTGLKICVVVAEVQRCAGRGEIVDFIRKLVDKITVMRNDKQRAIVAQKCVFKRLAGIDIEVVRRFVEDQKVRFGKHQL